MKNAVAAFLPFILLVFGANPQKAKGWRGIIPLRSTRADVERLLGSEANKPECVQSLCSYYLDDVNVHFNYSSGGCNSGGGGWEVPLDTVIWITVYPRPHPRLSDLNID